MAKVIVINDCDQCPWRCRYPQYPDCQKYKKNFSDGMTGIAPFCRLDDHEDIDWTREGI